MAELTPEETQVYLGRAAPNAAEIAAERERMAKDPLGYWWSTITGQKDTLGGNIFSANGGGTDPMRSPNEAQAFVGALQLQRDVRNAPQMDEIYRAGAQAPDRANPYNTGVADQTRAAQMALIQQMRGQMNGPSLAAMQGQRAMGQSGQQALGMAASGGPNARMAMLRSAQVGQGLAGDVGQARLAEVMRAQAGMGGAAGNLRGGDLRSADAQMQAGFQQRGQDDALRRFYASQGAGLLNARLNADMNRQIANYQLLSKANKRDQQTWQNFAEQSASMTGMGGSFSGGGGAAAPHSGGPSGGSKEHG